MYTWLGRQKGQGGMYKHVGVNYSITRYFCIIYRAMTGFLLC